MPDAFALETPLWEIALRGTVVYLVLGLLLRLIPKRHSGELSPNDLIALILVGTLGADAMVGDSRGMLDLLLMALVVFLWDYLFNLMEYRFPRFRKIAQDSPTLLVHDGRVLEDNMRKEKITREELEAGIRKEGLTEVGQARLVILEADGRFSVVPRE